MGEFFALVGSGFSQESEDAWIDFLRDMLRRGLNAPVLIISDGAPGLINAIEAVFPKRGNIWGQISTLDNEIWGRC